MGGSIRAKGGQEWDRLRSGYLGAYTLATLACKGQCAYQGGHKEGLDERGGYVIMQYS